MRRPVKSGIQRARRLWTPFWREVRRSGAGSAPTRRLPPSASQRRGKKAAAARTTKTGDADEAGIPPSGGTAPSTVEGSLAGGTLAAPSLDGAGTATVSPRREAEGADGSTPPGVEAEPGATFEPGAGERLVAEEPQVEAVVVDDSSPPAHNSPPTAPEIPEELGNDTKVEKPRDEGATASAAPGGDDEGAAAREEATTKDAAAKDDAPDASGANTAGGDFKNLLIEKNQLQ